MWVRKRTSSGLSPLPQASPQVVVAEVDVEIFGLRRPVAGDGELETAADGPADVGFLIAAEAGLAGADVAEGGTTCDVGHEPVEGVADATADGAEPGVLGLAQCRQAACEVGRAVDIGPVEVAFEAEHPVGDLPIVADGAADHPTVDVERAGRVPARLAPGAAAVDADVEAGPVVDRGVDRDRPLRDRLVAARQIGRTGGSSQSQDADARKNYAFHFTHPPT